MLPVRDVIRSLEHYRRLGFTVRPYEPAGPDGPFYGFVSSGGGELHLARTRDLDPKANTSACYIYAEDADALHGAWTASGGQTEPT